MPLARKRRSGPDAEPSPPPVRRRRSPSASEASSGDVDDTVSGNGEDGGASGHNQMVKKLVRLALASEYSRTPIRRTDITAKVMAPNAGRQYKNVLADAQIQLRSVFGMEMTELPQREKITVSQKRAAQRNAASQSTNSSKSYILTSTLPAHYRIPSILPPARIPSTGAEGAYTGLYTFVVSIIWLSAGGKISENHLDQALKRMNADNCVLGGEKTETVLKKMERQGYIVKVRERDGGGEESVDYVVGPRGKAEVGERGVAGVVRKVYGSSEMKDDELERRLVRSLGDVVIEKRIPREEEGEQDREANSGDEEEEQERRRGGRRQTKPSSRRGAVEDEAEEDEDEEDEEDEE